MHYIDIHTHLNLPDFKDDYNEVVERTLQNDAWIINVGTQYGTSKRAVEMLDEYPEGVYATVGLHPVYTSAGRCGADDLCVDGEVFDTQKYKELVNNKKVVAIGECGLDYFHNTSDKEKKKQIEAFEAQIAFANEVDKPLMLHLRSGKGGDAYKNALGILKKQVKVKGNAHFFAGSLEDAKRFWDMGFSTSFTGVITFTHDYDEVVKNAPKDLIHAETDAPYVAPVPYRGQRNEPLHVREVVKKIAEIRGVSEKDIQVQLMKNAKQMFRLV